MTSRADELAEAVEQLLEDHDHSLDGLTEGQILTRLEQALHRYRNSAPSEADTIKVRIAVAVSRVTDSWNACGWTVCDDPMSYAIENVEPPEDRYYVTVRLPKPAPVPEIDDVEVESC